MKPGVMKPAVIVGLISGVVFAVPYLRLINCICCIGMVVTGLAAGWIYSNACKSAGFAFTGSDGAKIGLIAGGVSALVSIVLGLVLEQIVGQPDTLAINEAVFDWMQQNEGIPEEQLAEMEENIEALRAGEITMGQRIQGIAVGLLLGPIFSVLGGLLAGSLFKQDAAPTQDPAA